MGADIDVNQRSGFFFFFSFFFPPPETVASDGTAGGDGVYMHMWEGYLPPTRGAQMKGERCAPTAAAVNKAP